MIATAAINSKNLSVRQQAVEHLSESLNSSGSFTATKANNYLKDFSVKDFDETSKTTIRKFLTNFGAYNYFEVAKMAASKGVGTEQLATIYHNEKMSVDKKWNIAIALSRLGYEETIDWLTLKLAKAEPSSEFVLTLVPDLIYTRQKKLVDYCVKLLQTPNLKCDCANSDISNKTDCGYRIMEWLAPIIKNYPIKFNSSGTLDSDKEYKEALIIVRKWFEKNPDYEISEVSKDL